MTVNSSTATVPTTPVYGTTGAVRTAKKVLGQEDFLKLMTVQLAHQDPNKPVDDNSFIAQMAQFTTLEQSSQMAKDITALRSDFSLQSASALIGRAVTVDTANRNIAGTVDFIDAGGGAVKLNVGGSLYNLSSVVRVAPSPVAIQP